MGLPKNFHKKNNLPKVIESLNELNFYNVNYTVKFTKEYDKQLREAELNDDIVIHSEFDVVTRNLEERSVNCSINFSAIDDEVARRKINEWLEIRKESGKIESYEINKVISNGFYEELEKKGLLPLIDEKEFNKIKENSK